MNFRDLNVPGGSPSINNRLSLIAGILQGIDDNGRVSMSVIPGILFGAVQWSPAAVAANTSAEQTVTVRGLKVGDVVTVSKPTAQAGLVLGLPRVSAHDTLAVTFGNFTVGAITPTALEIYSVVAFRNV